MKLLLSVFLTSWAGFSLGQAPSKMVDHLPNDLNQEKIIFLRYDSAAIDLASNERGYIARQKNYNKAIPKSNAKLMKSVEEYPFPYVVAYEKDLPRLKQEGVKYVISCDAFKIFREGTWNSDPQLRIHHVLYIYDLTTDTGYIVDRSFLEGFILNYPLIMEQLLKKIKRQFKNK